MSNPFEIPRVSELLSRFASIGLPPDAIQFCVKMCMEGKLVCIRSHGGDTFQIMYKQEDNDN